MSEPFGGPIRRDVPRRKLPEDGRIQKERRVGSRTVRLTAATIGLLVVLYIAWILISWLNEAAI